MVNKNLCRLCSNDILVPRFELKGPIEFKQSIRYLFCERCCSLQTEYPYWSEDAHKSGPSETDFGSVQRSINNAVACYIIAKLLKLKSGLDVGGGNGLLSRLLRDACMNFYNFDPYCQYQIDRIHHTKSMDGDWDLISSFEVAEHATSPFEFFSMIFKSNPKILIISTQLYENQKSNWWYLDPKTAQHTFFYSKTSIEFIASFFKYNYLITKNYIIYYETTISKVRISAVRLLVDRLLPRLITKIYFILSPKNGISRDLKKIQDINRLQ